MRASSPSPPGRLYPLPKHYFEGVHSPSSSSSESSSVSSSHSPLNKAPDPGSSPPLSSLSGPNPFWLALIADLDNLDSSSPRVPGEEIEAAPHTREEEDKKCRGWPLLPYSALAVIHCEGSPRCRKGIGTYPLLVVWLSLRFLGFYLLTSSLGSLKLPVPLTPTI
jgi:hypothetical protein